ncbi:MAG: protein kinase, partial [Planctomycetes bacterium]|nr:protein kinase [Planctomycetota bacterium]
MAETANRQKDIFLKAIELPSPGERAAFLAEACAGDDALRQRVEAMLKAHTTPDSFLEKPAAALDLTVDASGGNPPANALLGDGPGTRIGPYKLLEQIGEGGMGVVYMAEQQEPVRRTVALKIIKPGMDSGQVLARFEAERQALALMDHPNIARVLDAGATADGRPFFVMELVKGTPITTFCDERRLNPRERLELFVSVCQAIQHAHQKGVIHRDIKPSNVLVALYDDRPVPKVIDFGVAKAAGQALTEKTLHTGFGAIIGTPEYMSPEQATFNQLDIDTRSDVYALGVLLYELLTGTTPVDKTRLKEAAFLEVLRVVREEEPARPSVKLSTTQARAGIAATRGTGPDELAQLLRGELDWIVMKSLEKDRSRRYETAAGLGRDVERYLKDELVEARPPSAGYRLRKFVRRNRGTVLAAGAVLVALLIGTICTTLGLFEARHERDDADRARRAETKQLQRAQENEATAIAAKEDAGKALTRSEGLRLILQSELVRPSNPSLAMLLAIEGAERAPGLLANNTLLAAMDQSREERTLPGAGSALCFSADGRRVLTRHGQDVRIWDVPSGKELVQFEKTTYFHERAGVRTSSGVATLPGHPPGNSGIIAASFDRKDRTVLTSSEYGIVALWDAATGKQIHFLQKGVEDWTPEDEANRRNGHEYACPAQFSPDGRWVLATHHKTRIWDADTGKEHLVLKGHDASVLWSEFSRDGKKIITASRDTTSRIWDAASGKQLHVLKGHATNAVARAFFSPDGSKAVTVASPIKDGVSKFKDTLCRFWDPETGKELTTLGASGSRLGYAASVQFSPDSSRMLSYDSFRASVDEPAWHFWDANTGKHLQQVSSRQPHGSASFTPDGKRVAFFDEGVEWWNAQKLERERADNIRGRALFSPDNQRLATADAAGVHIWAVAGEAERRLGHWTQLKFLCLNHDGRLLATHALDPSEVVIWDLAAAQEIARFKAKGAREVFARFSLDGRKVIFGGENDLQGTVWVGDVGTGQLLALLHGQRGTLRDAGLSPDSLRAVTLHVNSGNHALRIWDLATAKELAEPRIGTTDGNADTVRFSPDGRWLLTAQETGHRLREAATGKERAIFKGQFGNSRSDEPILFSPDSRRVLTT